MNIVIDRQITSRNYKNTPISSKVPSGKGYIAAIISVILYANIFMGGSKDELFILLVCIIAGWLLGVVIQKSKKRSVYSRTIGIGDNGSATYRVTFDDENCSYGFIGHSYGVIPYKDIVEWEVNDEHLVFNAAGTECKVDLDFLSSDLRMELIKFFENNVQKDKTV